MTEPQEQGIAKYQYQPLAKVGSVGTLKALLQAQAPALAAVLPKHLTAERLFRTFLTAINRQPDLLECTQSSIVESVSRAGELGLDVSGTLQEAWILPFKNNIGTQDRPNWVKQAQLLPGYRGLAKLARNSGEIAKLEARVVKENDHFELEYGTNPRLVFRPLLTGDRGKTIGCYAYAKTTAGEEIVDWMDTADVERIRRSSKQPNSLMWREHWDEGARKTVFRRLAKWLPLSAERARHFLEALEESDREYDLDQGEAEPPAPGARTAALVERLKAGRQFDPMANAMAVAQEAKQAEIVVEPAPQYDRPAAIADLKATLKRLAPRGAGALFQREFGRPWAEVDKLTDEELAAGLERLKGRDPAVTRVERVEEDTRSTAMTIRQAADANGLSEERLRVICKGEPEEVPDSPEIIEEILEKIRTEGA